MILFWDDEARLMSPYVDELKLGGLQVEFRESVDEAYKAFATSPEAYKLLILDIMMPPGQLLKDENTEDGMRTGVFLYRRVREIAPRIPVIILTHVSSPDVERIFETDPNCSFLRKEDLFSDELLVQVKQRLGTPEDIDEQTREFD